MANPHIANALAIVNADAVVDSFDVGTTNPEGRIRIYDGVKPAAGPDEAIIGQTLLAELNMSNPSFGAASDQNPNARATANAISDDVSADATGTASWFRVVDRDNVAKLDGDVTATGGGGDLELNTVSIVAAAIVSVTSFTIDQLEE